MTTQGQQNRLPPETPSHYFDFDAVAHRYDRHRRPGGPFIPPLVRLAQESSARHVLEIGPGTGNSTQAFLASYPCELTGLDLSDGMLREAQRKGLGARWVNGDAHFLPLADGSVDFIFGVLFLHHLEDPRAFFHECYRVLGQGCAAFATTAHSFIERHPMNRYFPSFAAIDKARFPSIEDVLAHFTASGFSELGTERAKARPEPIDSKYVEKVANKFISTYAVIPKDEFEAGLRRLRGDVEREGRLAGDMEWEAEIVWGRK